MITTEINVGRLIEVRFIAPVSAGDVVLFEGNVSRLFRSIPEKIVACTDFTRSATIPPAEADKIIAMLRRDNPKLERNGILLPKDKAGVRLQVERMVREGQNPDRRTFLEIGPLIEWLDEALSEAEREQLRGFFGLAAPL
jgi:hypothetical protein